MVGPRVLLASALVALGCLTSCQLVLGGFEVTDAPPQSLIGGCKEGTLHCNDAWLFCESVKNDDFVLIKECPSAAQCDSTLGDCAVCNANDFRCNGAKLESCREDRTGWTLVIECATADECNLNSRSCRACTPGEMPQCSGTEQRELFECAEDQSWVSLGVCGTPELCQRSADAIAADPINAPRACFEPVCPTPGEYRCEADGLTLSRCAPDQTGWTMVDTCASQALCAATVADPDAATARGSTCVPPTCTLADTYRCTEQTLERCRPDLTGWDQIDTCVDPYQCNTNQRACTGPCTPGDLQCSGATLEQCSDAQVWAHSDDCVNASLCMVELNVDTGLYEGGCELPRCEPPGSYRCEGDVLQRCNPDQTNWDPIETCRSAPLCRPNDARCDPPICDPPGALSCNPLNPSELRVCREDMTDWDSVIVCAPTEACNTDPNGPSCVNQCPVPPEQCNGVVHERCSGTTGAPVWTGQATCRTQELCQCGLDGSCAGGLALDGLCGNPVCGANLGSTRCTGAVLETCHAGRNHWAAEDAITCTSAANCVPGTPADLYFDNGYCAVCSVGGERQCNGTTALRTCSTDRRNWTTTTNCTIGVGCINSGTNDYCAECATGNVRCVAGSIQACAANSLWGTSTPCAVACVGSGNNSYCADCTVGQSQCTTGGVQSCGSNQLWGSSTACPLGCVDSGTSDYCAECTTGEVRCNGAGRQTCGANRRWGAVTACALGCVDSGVADYCAECTAGDTQCASGGVQTCGSNRLWGSASACALGCVDSGVADYCAECTAGDTQCASGGVQTCGSNRLWGSTSSCSLGCVNSGTSDYCAECDVGDSQCVSGGIQSCGSNQLWGSTSSCSLGCVNSGTSDYCAECDVGDSQCVSGGIQSCGSNQLWGSTTSCPLVCRDSGTNDYCTECASGDARCTGDDLETCNSSTLLWNAPSTCSIACVGSGNNGYCAECTPGDAVCQGDDLVTCEQNSLWGTPATCPFGCLDETPDRCAECILDTDCVSGTCSAGTCI